MIPTWQIFHIVACAGLVEALRRYTAQMEYVATKYLAVKQHYAHLNRYIPASFFALGFVFDLMTLGRIDDYLGVFSQASYLLILQLLFSDRLLQEQRGYGFRFLHRLQQYRDDIFHFLLGSLLSAFTIFFFKSSSLAASIIFMSILAALFVVNELPQFRQSSMVFKGLILQLCLLSYFMYLLPMLLGYIGHSTFILALLCSGLITAALSFMFKVQSIDIAAVKKAFIFPFIIIAAVFTVLHFSKAIPPIPLSIKILGIYHNVTRQEGQYHLYYQQKEWGIWPFDDTDFNARVGDSLYVFTSVFSPRGFNDKIFVHFQKQANNGDWKTTDKIPLRISGGRSLGFRGYAYKDNYSEGEWRVMIETQHELEIGRLYFNISADTSLSKREWQEVGY